MAIAAPTRRLTMLSHAAMQVRSRQRNGKRQPSAGKSRTTAMTPPVTDRVSILLERYRPGWSLPREFYFDEEVYRRDIEAIWRSGWLFVAHSCEISSPGDYVTLRMDTDSLLVVRSSDGVARAFHNVCRHRGSLVCREEQGHASRLVCPYHQWTYGTDGKLLACRGMPDDVDKTQLGLHPVHAREVGGLIYISLAKESADFEQAQALLSPILKPQGIARAKVAKSVDYQIPANWKLVWENNRECYHCNVNHPQYIKANFDHY